jgi:Peptidase family M28
LIRPPCVRRTVLCILTVSAMLMAQSNNAHLMQQKDGASRGKSADTHNHARQKTTLQAKKDPQIAAAVRDISPQQVRATDQKLVSFGTRNTLSANLPELAKQGKGIVAAREWIKSEFERYSKACGGCLHVDVDLFTQPADGRRIPQPTELGNVYAVLKGTDPENAKRVYIMGGHYDSRATDVLDAKIDAPGANDDGSGTTVTLEAARVLSKHKFPATIVFVTFPGEEQGLYGSKHFAQFAKEQGWEVNGVLSNDIVGGDTTAGQKPIVRVFSEGIPVTATEQQVKQIRAIGAENDSPSRELARYVVSTADQYVPASFKAKMIWRQDRYLRGGDHSSFNQEGFAAVRLTDWHENYDHQHQTVRTENGIQYGDLPKFVNFEQMANVARVNVAALASLASAPAPPQNVKIETKALTNDSTVTWQAAPGGRATGYQLVSRDTDASNWENAEAPVNATQITVHESKDNVVFAVRSVDAQGHKSLAVMPAPER